MSFPPPGGRFSSPHRPAPGGQPGGGGKSGPFPGPPRAASPPGAVAGRPRPKREPGLLVGLAVAGSAVVVLVVAVVLAWGASPSSVVSGYIAAAQDGDLNAVRALTCDRYRGDVTVADERARESTELLIEDLFERYEFAIIREQVDGGQAIVTVSVVGPGTDSMQEFRLIDEDGWKVCRPL